MGMNFLLQNSFSEKYMFHVPVDHAQNPYFSTMVMKFQKKSTVNIRVRIGLHNALLVVKATINLVVSLPGKTCVACLLLFC